MKFPKVPENKVRVLCAWCGLNMAPNADESLPVSHSICPRCTQEITSEIKILRNDPMKSRETSPSSEILPV